MELSVQINTKMSFGYEKYFWSTNWINVMFLQNALVFKSCRMFGNNKFRFL